MLAVIEYYIDGSAKQNTIGAGIVKINEYGFLDKRHFTIEHTNPSSQIAEGYSFEKALEMIAENDLNKNELIDLYTDCRELHNAMAFNAHIEIHGSGFFVLNEPSGYFQYLRDIYTALILRHSKSCIYHCAKTKQGRPLIKLFYKEHAEDKKYLQDAHSMSRKYIEIEEQKKAKIDLKAMKKDGSWHILMNNKKTIGVNKRPLIALSEALTSTAVQNKHIKLCDYLENLLKSTIKNKVSNDGMISAMKIIDKHKKSFVG